MNFWENRFDGWGPVDVAEADDELVRISPSSVGKRLPAAAHRPRGLTAQMINIPNTRQLGLQVNKHSRDLPSISQSRAGRHNVHGGGRQFAPELSRPVQVICASYAAPQRLKTGEGAEHTTEIISFKQAPRLCAKLTNRQGFRTRRRLRCVAQAANPHQANAECRKSGGMELVRDDISVSWSLTASSRADI